MPAATHNIDEQVELRIGRVHLQILAFVVSVLMSGMGYFLYKTANQLEKLSDSVTTFTAYQQVNDLKQIQFGGKLGTLENEIEKKEERIRRLEDKVLLLENGRRTRPIE